MCLPPYEDCELLWYLLAPHPLVFDQGLGVEKDLTTNYCSMTNDYNVITYCCTPRFMNMIDVKCPIVLAELRSAIVLPPSRLTYVIAWLWLCLE
jgi:hypothetical protein